MPAITAAMVGELRAKTDAPMMECKKALSEADGDMARAEEILRVKLGSKAGKAASRVTAEGIVVSSINGTTGALLEVNCETDFVAKNDSFVALTKSILDAAIEAKATDLETVKALVVNGTPVANLIVDEIGKTGEKMELGYYEAISAPYTTAYIHPGNKLATIVGFNLADTDYQVAHDVAMQAAAMSPIAVSRDEVPADVVEKELEIAKDKARQEGKKEEMLDKIAQGRLNKFYQEVCLLEQAFVKDPKQTIQQYLHSSNKELTAVACKRITLNEE